MNINIKYYKRYVIFFVLMCFVVTTNAQEVNVLDEIVLTEEKKESPLQLSIINNEISKKKNHDAGSLFSGVPGFGIDKKGGYAMDPVFRGFKYEQLNIQFDGGTTVAPACPNRMDPVTTHITPEEVEKIEIIKGPYSVRYGSSLGGVVNLVTKAPVYDADKLYRASLEGGYETNGGSYFSSLKAGVVQQNWYFTADGGIKRFGNYKSGSGQEIVSSFQTNDYSLKGGYSIDENQHIRVNFRQSFGRDIMHPGLPMDTDIDNGTVATVDYDNRFQTGFLKNIKIKAFYSDVEHVMSNSVRPSAAKVISTSTTYSQAYGGKIEFELGSNDDNIFYVGLDMKNIANQGDNEKVKPTGEFVSTKQVWQDSYVNDYGVFAQYNLHAGNDFSLQTGMRFDFVQSDTKEPDPKFEAGNEGIHPEDELNFSANISGIYRLSENWNTKLSVGRGVQTASIQKRYVNILPVGRDNFVYFGNPMLDAEINNQADLSLNRHGDKWWMGVNGYYSVVGNYISSELVSMPIPEEGIPGKKKFVNIDRAKIYGLELNFGFEIFKNLKFDASGFYTHAQNIDLDEPLAEIPPMEANISLMYENKKWYAKINQRLVAEQDRVAVSVKESASPGFGVMDLFGGYEINSHLRIDASIINIFNLNYYEHLNRSYKNMDSQSEFYNIGRNFMLSAKISL
ncbi:MAG: TonB-dependent receptor [Bacteroidota bacterium]